MVENLINGICNYTKPLNIIVIQLLNNTSLEVLNITAAQCSVHSVVELLEGCLILYIVSRLRHCGENAFYIGSLDG